MSGLMLTEEALEQYIEGHISPEPEHLQRLYRHTWLHHLYPRMCSGHLQGRILKMLTEMIAPRRVLELGTFTGYSALCIAEGLPSGATLDTVEIDDEMEDELRERFAPFPAITLHIGDAAEVVERLGGEWDMVFLDADKRRYPEFLSLLKPRMSPGGYILADNTLWSGQVIDKDAARDPQLRGIMQFNQLVAADPELESVIFPLRDGLSLIKRL